MTKQLDKVTVISYYPFLPRVGGKILDRSDIEVLKEYKEPNVMPISCGWLLNDDEPEAVLVFPSNARALARDMIDWAESKPSEFFNVIVDTHKNTYAIVIVPNIDRSISRFKFNHLITYGEPVATENFNTLFYPIGFVNRSSNPIFDSIRPSIGRSLKLSFIDNSADVVADLENRVPFGVLPICDKTYLAGTFSGFCDAVMSGG